MESRAAASRILMIGSSNFSRNFFQVGSRGRGVSLFSPYSRRLPATSSRPRPLSAVLGNARKISVRARMAVLGGWVWTGPRSDKRPACRFRQGQASCLSLRSRRRRQGRLLLQDLLLLLRLHLVDLGL